MHVIAFSMAVVRFTGWFKCYQGEGATRVQHDRALGARKGDRGVVQQQRGAAMGAWAGASPPPAFP